MFFVRTTVGDGFPVEIELYEDEIFTYCLGCEKEMRPSHKELIDILTDGDFCGTSLICSQECTEEWKRKIATAEDSD